ncbi:MAG TPA: hypothetical protein VGI39_07715, partial [Polyangiaceae bacterium]
MRTPRVVLAISIVSSTFALACVTDNGNPNLPDLDGSFDFDAAEPGIDVQVPDRAAPSVDAGHDATTPDAAPEAASGEDSSAPDVETVDSSEPVDTGMDATEPVDTGVDAAPPIDAGADVTDSSVIVDAAPDVVVVLDAGVDASPVTDAGFDAGFDAGPIDAGPPHCATSVSGNYYTRTDGAVVNMSHQVVIVEDATSAPLVGLTQVYDDVYSACALRGTDHTVWCWPSFTGGNNSSGQLGNGTFTDVTDSTKMFRATQVEISHPDGGAVTYLDQVTALPLYSEGAYVNALCAIRSDKTLWCWGPTTQGSLWQGTLGNTSDLAFATAITGDKDAGTPIGNVDQVSMGNRHACYVSGGKAYCWGNNTSGELGTGDTTTEPYPYNVTKNLPATIDAIAAMEDQTCVRASSQAFCWGADTYTSEGNPNVPTSICNSNYCEPNPVLVQAALADG